MYFCFGFLSKTELRLQRSDVKYLGNTRYDDLDADTEGEERNHFIDDNTAAVADFLDDLLPLRQKQIENRTHQHDDKGDDRVIQQALHPVAPYAGRGHQRENDRDAAGADADGKRNGIKYLGFDCTQADGVGVFFRYAAYRSVGIAEPLQRCSADQQAAAQLDDRQRQVEQRQYEVADGQTAEPDKQVVGENSPNDGLAGIFVQSRQKTVHEKSCSHGIRHRKQSHKGGYKHEDKTFDHPEIFSGSDKLTACRIST